MKTMKYYTSFQATPENLLTNRAINYGDGVFETILVSHKKMFLWDFHIQRLQESLLRLKIYKINEKELIANVISIVPDNKRYIVKIVVFRSGRKRGYTGDSKKPEYYITINPYVEAYIDNKLTVSPIKMARQNKLAGMKHLNRLEQVLAANYLIDSSYSDAIMCDDFGYVIETINQNIILIQDDCIVTPHLEYSGVFGVALRWLKAQGYHFNMKKIEINDLSAYHGMMVCNSIKGFTAINKIDDAFYFDPQLPLIKSIIQQWNITTSDL